MSETQMPNFAKIAKGQKQTLGIQTVSIVNSRVLRDGIVAQMSALVRMIVGHDVGVDEPLMAAGLDSLGEHALHLCSY